MVPIKNLRPGDRVKIVDQFKPCGSYRFANPVREMRLWLGQTVTVKYVETEYSTIRIAEDKWGWAWDPDMLDYIVEDDPIVPASEADFLSLLTGKELCPATN